MSFIYTGALAIILLAIAPIVAHLLRVHTARTRPFAAVHLIANQIQQVRQREKLNDPWLLAIRGAMVAALALVGAIPLCTQNKLMLARPAGASMAVILVIDDSLSMRVRADGKQSRFDIAKQRALQLVQEATTSASVANTKAGADTIGVVLAGHPSRISLAPTTDIALVEKHLRALQFSDRSTDLDGALQLASSLVQASSHPLRTIVVLSDLCDGNPSSEPLGKAVHQDVWFVPLETSKKVHDCAVLQAERRNVQRDQGQRTQQDRERTGTQTGLQSGKISVKIACSGLAQHHDPVDKHQRTVTAKAGNDTVGQIELDPRIIREGGVIDVVIETRSKASEADTVVLEGSEDWIKHDDSAPVAQQLKEVLVGVVTDPVTSAGTMGGPPVVQQAIHAIISAEKSSIIVQPLTSIPDNKQQLAKYSTLVIDNPETLGPELRDAVEQWLRSGASALVALGQRSSRPTVGTSLQPLVTGAVQWQSEAAQVDVPTVMLGPTSRTLADIGARSRAIIPTDRLENAKVLASWRDGQALIVHHRVGKGMVYLTGIPFDPQHNDLVFRPAFLALLTQLLQHTKRASESYRAAVGTTWLLDSPPVSIYSRKTIYPFEIGHFGDFRARVTPAIAGRYDIVQRDGDNEQIDSRYAVISAHEINFTPRKVKERHEKTHVGSMQGKVDLSRWICMVLLAFGAAEIVLRLLRLMPARYKQTRTKAFYQAVNQERIS